MSYPTKQSTMRQQHPISQQISSSSLIPTFKESAWRHRGHLVLMPFVLLLLLLAEAAGVGAAALSQEHHMEHYRSAQDRNPPYEEHSQAIHHPVAQQTNVANYHRRNSHHLTGHRADIATSHNFRGNLDVNPNNLSKSSQNLRRNHRFASNRHRADIATSQNVRDNNFKPKDPRNAYHNLRNNHHSVSNRHQPDINTSQNGRGDHPFNPNPSQNHMNNYRSTSNPHRSDNISSVTSQIFRGNHHFNPQPNPNRRNNHRSPSNPHRTDNLTSNTGQNLRNSYHHKPEHLSNSNHKLRKKPHSKNNYHHSRSNQNQNSGEHTTTTNHTPKTNHSGNQTFRGSYHSPTKHDHKSTKDFSTNTSYHSANQTFRGSYHSPTKHDRRNTRHSSTNTRESDERSSKITEMTDREQRSKNPSLNRKKEQNDRVTSPIEMTHREGRAKNPSLNRKKEQDNRDKRGRELKRHLPNTSSYGYGSRWRPYPTSFSNTSPYSASFSNPSPFFYGPNHNPHLRHLQRLHEHQRTMMARVHEHILGMQERVASLAARHSDRTGYPPRHRFASRFDDRREVPNSEPLEQSKPYLNQGNRQNEHNSEQGQRYIPLEHSKSYQNNRQNYPDSEQGQRYVPLKQSKVHTNQSNRHKQQNLEHNLEQSQRNIPLENSKPPQNQIMEETNPQKSHFDNIQNEESYLEQDQRYTNFEHARPSQNQIHEETKKGTSPHRFSSYDTRHHSENTQGHIPLIQSKSFQNQNTDESENLRNLKHYNSYDTARHSENSQRNIPLEPSTSHKNKNTETNHQRYANRYNSYETRHQPSTTSSSLRDPNTSNNQYKIPRGWSGRIPDDVEVFRGPVPPATTTARTTTTPTTTTTTTTATPTTTGPPDFGYIGSRRRNCTRVFGNRGPTFSRDPIHHSIFRTTFKSSQGGQFNPDNAYKPPTSIWPLKPNHEQNPTHDTKPSTSRTHGKESYPTISSKGYRDIIKPSVKEHLNPVVPPTRESPVDRPCIKCPPDVRVKAPRGRDCVYVHTPSPPQCTPRWMPGIQTKIVSGPRPGQRLNEGHYVMVVVITGQPSSSTPLATCTLNYDVTVKKCEEQKPGPGAEVWCTAGRAWGSRCMWSCAEGFTLDGAPTTTCIGRHHPQWSQPPPTCKETNGCSAPPEVAGGHYICQDPLDSTTNVPVPRSVPLTRFKGENTARQNHHENNGRDLRQAYSNRWNAHQNLGRKHRNRGNTHEDLTLKEKNAAQNLRQTHHNRWNAHQNLGQNHRNRRSATQDLSQKNKKWKEAAQDLRNVHQNSKNAHKDLGQKHRNTRNALHIFRNKHQTGKNVSEDRRNKYYTGKNAAQNLRNKHWNGKSAHKNLRTKHRNKRNAHQDLETKHRNKRNAYQDLRNKGHRGKNAAHKCRSKHRTRQDTSQALRQNHRREKNAAQDLRHEYYTRNDNIHPTATYQKRNDNTHLVGTYKRNDNTHPIGTVCELECAQGRKAFVSQLNRRRLTCTSEGRWDQEPPICHLQVAPTLKEGSECRALTLPASHSPLAFMALPSFTTTSGSPARVTCVLEPAEEGGGYRRTCSAVDPELLTTSNCSYTITIIDETKYPDVFLLPKRAEPNPPPRPGVEKETTTNEDDPLFINLDDYEANNYYDDEDYEYDVFGDNGTGHFSAYNYYIGS